MNEIFETLANYIDRFFYEPPDWNPDTWVEEP